MKRITMTYLSLLLILTSVFSTPLSVAANTDPGTGNEEVELEVDEEAAEDEVAEEEETPEESSSDIETTNAGEEAETEEKGETESEAADAVEEEESSDEERYGFAVEVREVLNADGNHFTEKEGLDPEETFTLRLANILEADQNYQKDDVETIQLPSSVVVAETRQGTVNSNGEDIASYTIHNNGQMEFTFTEAVETVGAVNEPVDVEVYINENSVDEAFAYITPIEGEEQIAVPLAVEGEDEEEAEESTGEETEEPVEEEVESTEETETAEEETEEAAEESEENEASEEESTAESPETEEENKRSIGIFAALEENLLSSFELVIINTDGNQTVVENGEELEVNPENMNALQLNYGIIKPDEIKIAEGDTYTIGLPSIYGGQEVGGIPITIDGVEVGTYSIVDGEMEITFNAAVNDYDDVEMNVNLSGQFNVEVFEEVEEVAVDVPFRDGTSYSVTIRAERQDYEGTDMKEAGSPYIQNEDGERIETGRNPEFIDWTVRVNDSMNSVENATVIDELSENLEIVEDSFIVERIIRNYNNEEVGREAVDVTPSVTGSGFELNLGEIEDAYEITYTTSVARPDGGGTHTVNNDARIILDGDETAVSDGFEGTWSGDLPGITKNGSLSNGRTDLIDWRIEYNYDEESIGTVSLTDELSHGEVLIETVQVFQVNTDIDGNIVGEPSPVDVSPVVDDEGNLTLPGLDADGQAYYITFSSSVPVGLNDTVVNTISDNLPSPNVDDASVDVNTIPTGGKVGEQLVDEDGNPYIEWTITMNSEKIDVNSIRVTDVFDPEYLEFDVEDGSLFSLFRDGEEADNFEIGSYEHDDGRTGFTLGITDAGPYTYEFVYRTYYTVAGMQEPQLANNAELIFEDGDGIGIGDSVNLDIDQTRPNVGIEKNGRYVSSDDNTQQEIEWTVAFNNSRILLDEGSTLTDTFTSGNYEYIADSLEVMTGTGNGLDYTHDENDDGFVITLGEATNETVTVTYRTTTDDTDNLPHVNDVVLDWQGGEEETQATVGMRDPGISKSGEVVINEDGSKTINWTVDFNTNSNILHDVVISENLQPADTTVSDIEISRDGVSLEEGAYAVSNPGQNGETFTIEMDRLDAVPYQLTYSSTLSPEQEIEVISNNVDISYTGGEQGDETNIPSPELGVQKEAVNIDKELDPERINWRITANTDAGNHFVNLVDPVLTDTIPDDQQLVPGSIEVVRVDNDEDLTGALNITEGTNDFSINLPDGPYQYVVTFQTEILEFPSVNEQIDRYTNSTTLSNDNHEDVSDDAYIDYFADGTNNSNTKMGGVNEDTENIDWEATVNPLGLTINNAVITDVLSDNQTYVADSIQITDGSGDPLPAGSYDVTLSDDNQSFTVEFLGDGQINQPINVSYSTRLNPELIGFYDVSNTINLTGGQEERQLSSTTETTSTSQWSYGGGGSGRTLEFNLEKLHEESETPIPGATFEFIRVTPNGTEVPMDNVVTTDEDGTFLIENARAGRYIVNETDVPEGYEQLQEPFHIIIGYSTPEEIEAGAGDYKVTVTDANWNPAASEVASTDSNTLMVYNELETGSVSATKEWVDAEESDYPTTWLMLYRNLEGEEPEPVEGAEIKELNSDSPFVEVTWDDIEMNAPNLEPYIFSVKEVDSEGNDFTPPGFTKDEDGLTVTNTATFVDIDVNKEWEDGSNQDGIRPDSVEVQLMENGSPSGDIIELNEDNDWSHTFEDLREYRDGNPIEYTAVEVNIPEGYESSSEVSDDGSITITNTHIPETMEVSVSKVWEDGEDQDGVRPDNVYVNLLDGSQVLQEVVLNEGNDWQHTFTDLPRFNNGQEIQYSVTEDAVANYSTFIETTNTDEGLNSIVTNTYTPEETTATVTKVWDDGNNQDGNRPETVTVQLLANGEPHGEPVVITAAEEWTHTWTGLDLNAAGEAIDYTVQEIDAPEGYEVSLDNDDHGNLVITNAYEPEVTDISVTKSWDDAEDQDGVRPDDVEINLLADGEIERTVVIDADGEWRHTFTDLPVYDNSVEINYTVTENTVEGYSAAIVEESENNFVITNSHTPEETTVTVTKAWDDANNQDGNRPSSIEVQLIADGEAEGEPVTLTATEDWSYTWTGLDANTGGEPIEYTVTELDVGEDYTVTVNDEDHGNIIITNSYIPELTEVPVTKVWDDANDQDGERPGSVTLNLLNDRGEIVRSAVVQEQEGNEWAYTFTNIPRYENGTEINYSVTENFVSDYSTEIDQDESGGHIVTNSYTPEETSVTATKGWNDANDQDGERPQDIEVQLTADGEATGEPVTLSEDNDWTFTWDELALNADGEAIDYSVEEVNVPEGYTSSINDADHGNIIVTNSYTPSLIDVPVEKVWEDADDQDRVRPDQVIVNLINGSGELESRVILSEENDWQHTFTNLPEFNNGEPINYTITENTVEDYSTDVEEANGVHVVTNSYTPEETSVTVVKGWEDANNQDGNRPVSIEVQLLANGEPEGDAMEITAENDWTYTWQGLDANEAGEAIEYSVEELNIPEEYEITLNDADHGNIVLMNSYTPETTDVSGTKTWDDADDQDGLRPDSITVNLLADGEQVETSQVSQATGWSYNFTDLPVYAAGEEIEYTVEEVAVEGYETEIDGFDITNSHTPATTEISGVKIWDDADNQDGKRPDSITVNLLADGEKVDSAEVGEDTDWTYNFTDLPVFEAGEEINYTVTENTVEEYTTEIDNDNHEITNSYTPGETSVTVTKNWDDSNNQDGIRSDAVDVQLTADGEAIGDPVTLSDDNDWTYTWSELDEMADGESIDYSVIELDATEDYEVEVDDSDHGNIIITNSYTPETTEVAVSKIWDDNDNQDGNRPNNVTVNLLNDSEVVTEAVLSEDNDWQHTFTDLPVYENGDEIQYSITENAVAGYSTNIETTNGEEGLNSVITNSYTPEETTATVTKVWNDANNQDGNRPETVVVQLYADGEAHGEPVEITAAEDWTYTWTGLDLNASGEAIDYAVQELDVANGYEAAVNNNDHGNMVITNTYEPEVTEVDISKLWDDAENQDGVRPESVTVNLLADGEIERTAVIDADGDWNHTFTGLPVYDNGNKITYTITENTVEDYSASIVEENENDFVVTNMYTPEETSVTVVKGWDDSNNQDGNRPESIDVQLTADGEATGDPVTLSPDNNWTATWSGLALNNDGAAVNYSVEELDVPEGYTSSVNDDDHGSMIITNSYTPETIELPVMKIWDDSDNQDGVRPDHVTVNLVDGEGKVVEQVVLSEDNDWKHTFADLPANSAGEAINYRITENAVAGYSTSITENNDGAKIITNAYTPEETSVTVVKGWDDENNQGDNRPKRIKVQLTADGEAAGRAVTLSEKNEWTHTWDGLALNDDGEAINYSIEEVEIPAGYTASVNDENHGNIIVTNSLLPKVSVGDYVWIDENHDGLQDETDTPLKGVELVITDADGNPVTDIYGDPVGPTVTDENGWYTFENLPIDNEYVVSIDRDKFEDRFPRLSPTIEVEGDRENDSSTWTATSIFLNEDGQRDPTLDFGFVTPEVPVSPEDPVDSEDPEDSTDSEVPSEEEESTETPADEGTPEAEGEEGSPETPADEGTPEAEGEEGSPETPTDEGTPETEEEEGAPETLTDEGTPEIEGEEGTPETPTAEGTPETEGEEETSGGALPNTGIALGNTIAILASILLVAGAVLLFFTRRRN